MIESPILDELSEERTPWDPAKASVGRFGQLSLPDSDLLATDDSISSRKSKTRLGSRISR